MTDTASVSELLFATPIRHTKANGKRHTRETLVNGASLSDQVAFSPLLDMI